MKYVTLSEWVMMSIMTWFALSGYTATVEWVGASGVEGSWTNAANWSGSNLPGEGDTARVSNGGIVALDSDLSASVNPALQLSNGSTLRVQDGAATTNMTVNLYESNIELSGGLLHMPAAPVSQLGARGTNRIVMTGGILSGTARYGNAANVDTTLFLSNGTVVSEHYDAYYGGAGGTATVIQEGGYHGWRLILGSGGTGRYFLNDGELYAIYPFIGRGNGVGYLEVGPKGRITLGGRLGGPVYMANGDNTTGTIILNGVTNNLVENGLLQNTFAAFSLCSNAGMSLPVNNSTATLIFNNCQLALTNGIVFNRAYNSQMSLLVNGGQVSIRNAQSALTTLAWPTSNSSNTTATVTVTNGAVFSAGILNMYSGGSLINAGGEINVASTFKSYSTNTVVDLLAGSMMLGNQIYIGDTRSTEFRMRDGHALQILDFQDTAGTHTNEFLLTYLLHKKPEWQVPITFTGTSARRNGHLRVALEGGVLLADTNACVVAETLNSLFYGNQPFMSVPDISLWMESRSVDIKHSVVTLAEAGEKGNLTMGGAPSLTFDPAAMGYVSLANVTTRRVVDLSVRLNVEPQGETTLEDIVAGFISSGYTNSVVEAGDDGCSVTLAIPADAVYDTEGTVTKSYFIWDFTRTTAQDPDVVKTNAVVSKISFAYSKLPMQGTVILLH